MLGFLKEIFVGDEIIAAIDLGTSNSVVAFLNKEGVPQVIESEGKQITPSVVAFKDGQIIVGDAAVRQMVLNPHGTIFSAKRFIGRDFSEVKDNGAAWVVPYVVRPSYDKKSVAFEVNGSLYDPSQIGAEVLKKLKAAAESYHGKTIKSCVITVPAWFNDRQRQATKDAGIIAGFERVIGVINEPTAAALAYAVEAENEIKENETILVYDLGGGTMDATVLRLKADGKNFVETLSTRGDISLGGDNFDEIIITDIVQKFLKDHSIDLTKTPEAMARVREAAIKLKIDLSSVDSSEIKLPFLVVDQNGPKHLEYDLSRAEFEEKISHLVKKSIKIALDCVADAKLTPKDINKILLVGGSTRVPLVLKELKSALGKEPIGNRGVDLIVALGAAVYSGIIKESDSLDIEFEDVTALNLGVRTINDVFSPIIKANTKIPCTAKDTFSTTADGQTEAEIVILQGMDSKASSKENHVLGTLLLEGIEPRKAGEPRIDIEYTLDQDGILSVKAVDDKGRSIDITLKNASKLDKREIQRMKKESNLAPEDRKELEEARAELGKEIQRLEKEAAKASLPEAKKVTAIAKVEEAGRLLKESLDADAIERKARDIEKIG